MAKTYRQGASGALLDEYEKAILELQQVINDISNDELIKIVDHQTSDPRCRSVQTILSHVVRSGYAYAIYIRNHRGHTVGLPGNSLHLAIQDYKKDLNDIFSFTADTLSEIKDSELEESEYSKKFTTSWGQIYDIEQIIEHAIVHILRHRRQIEKFKIALRLN